MTPSSPLSPLEADIATLPPAVVLIGPVGVGKSTQGRLLATRLGLPNVSLDQIGAPYYEEAGVGHKVFQRIRAEQGFLVAYRTWWPALAHAVERVLAEHGRVILDLGAGHSHYEDPQLFERVRQVLAPCPNVVLLLPCADLDRSVRLLRERSEAEREWGWAIDGYDFLERWVRDSCNHDLATMIVYTEGRTPEETCDEILSRLHPSSWALQGSLQNMM